MGKNNKKKVLFIICEGQSDDVTLHSSIANFSKSEIKILQVETTNGDLAYKEEINETNCVDYVAKKVQDFKQKMFLYAQDFFAVVHIIDTDGAFIPSSLIIEDVTVDANIVKNGKLYTRDKEKTLNRFSKKTKIYQKLYSINSVENVKYYKFFFSRNLEHALYDIPNATIQQKTQLSNEFDERYKNNKEEFYEVIKSLMFDIPDDYEESWAYIFDKDNSLIRGSNLKHLLDMIKSKQ